MSVNAIIVLRCGLGVRPAGRRWLLVTTVFALNTTRKMTKKRGQVDVSDSFRKTTAPTSATWVQTLIWPCGSYAG